MPDRHDRRIALTCFKTADVPLLDTHLGGQVFLRQPRIQSPKPNVLPHHAPNIHRGMARELSGRYHVL